MRRNEFLPIRLEGVRSAQPATTDQLRLCTTERDAFLVSVQLSGLTYEELAARIGVSKQAVHKWGREGVPHKRLAAFSNATGTTLVSQFIQFDRLLKQAAHGQRESDRIAAIASQIRSVA